MKKFAFNYTVLSEDNISIGKFNTARSLSYVHHDILYPQSLILKSHYFVLEEIFAEIMSL